MLGRLPELQGSALKPGGRDIAVFALTAAALLIAWSIVKHQGGPAGGQTCEDLCMVADHECGVQARSVGGFPALGGEESERRAMCNGVCYLMRKQAEDPDARCVR